VSHNDLSDQELVLLCARTRDALAWKEFVVRFHRLVATVTMRTCRRYGSTSLDVIDDLVQDTYAKLWDEDRRILRSFEALPGGSFHSFLKVVAANVAHDHFKRELSAKRGGAKREAVLLDDATTAVSSASPGSTEASERGILSRELDALLSELVDGASCERDRRIFWLYYRVGLTAEAISRLASIGLGVKGVESTILRLSRLLRDRVLEAPLSRVREVEEIGHALEGVPVKKSL
jgi:RNA polymerase sigma factor (sigma-70 family)